MRCPLIARLAGMAAGLALMSSVALAQSHWDSARRAHIFAGLPNWTGLWESKISASSNSLSGYASIGPAEFLAEIPLAGRPPYTPAWDRQHQGDKGNSKPFKACVDIRFPFLLEGTFMFQVLVTPEETVFLYDNGEARQIYTDGRKHPQKGDLWPTDTGNSIGRWDGATLIIDTVGVKSGPIAPVNSVADLSDRAHFTERVRLISPNALEDKLEIDDPARFTHPWQISTLWSRVLDQDRLLPYDCNNDRNPVIDRRLSVASPQ